MKRLFLIICAATLMCSCVSQPSQSDKTVTVKLDTVSLYGVEPISRYSGRVRASQDINLSFKVSGTILKTAVKDGQFVRKGDLLIEMDSRDYALQLSATEAEYKQIKGEAERVIELYKRNSISKNDYEKAVYGLEQISAKYQAHQNALADTRIVAPFDGYVLEYRYHAGETVAAGYPVLSFYNDKNIEIEVYVPREEYDRRDEFSSLSSRVGDSIVPLSFVSLSPKANLNQLYAMLVKVDNSNIKPAVGSIATIEIRYKPSQSSEKVVPTTSIFRRDNKSYVWVYSNGTVRSRQVEPKTIYADGFISIEGDIELGETVVSGGVRSLKENQAVRAIKAQAASNIGGIL